VGAEILPCDRQGTIDVLRKYGAVSQETKTGF